MTDETSSDADDPGSEGLDAGARSARGAHRSRRWQLGALALVVVVLLAGGGWWLWHEDHTFCHEVAALPDVTGSIDRTGSPADGMLAYADQLDQVADEAPDADTAAAARTVASAQRSVAQSLQADPVASDAAAAVGTVADSTQATALQQLQQSISQHCPAA